MNKKGKIVGVNANVLTVEFEKAVFQNEVAFVLMKDRHLKCEVIRIRENKADMQVYEDTTGVKVGDEIEFTNELLGVELGPGLLGRIFDGLQNPLPKLAEQYGFFLRRGTYFPALPRDRKWKFTPVKKPSQQVKAGDTLGTVPEGIFTHRIMVPFSFPGTHTLTEIANEGSYDVTMPIAKLKNGKEIREVCMVQQWPIKIPITCYAERMKPAEQLITKIRIMDSFFPVARGGTYCIPGPFGSGKTVLQQLTSKHAAVDIVVIAACGERAGEVVETLRTFPELTDPRTGKKLMERTIIICNTSSMPVAAREASIYTAVTIAEYYRQMALNVLLLADSTSRWAQALRETSGRLEEIPGEEAFPAYLESVIAAFYERASIVRLQDNSYGSITIGGTVSPAGGNFEEPVTQATLKVVGAFHGLSRERSEARRYPAIHPIESWSKYESIIPAEQLNYARSILRNGNEISQMMKVVGEEGTPLKDFIVYLKSEYLDAVFLQQDAYDEVDGATDAERQKYVFDIMNKILKAETQFKDKNQARKFFQSLTQKTKDFNRIRFDDEKFKTTQKEIENMLLQVANHA